MILQMHYIYMHYIQKLGSRFNIKDKNPKKHENNLVYKFKCSECPSTYIGERLEERVIDHNKRDKNSHILKHSKERNHQQIDINDVKILSKNFRTNEKRKLRKALFIRSLKPTNFDVFTVFSELSGLKRNILFMKIYIPIKSSILSLTKYSILI